MIERNHEYFKAGVLRSVSEGDTLYFIRRNRRYQEVNYYDVYAIKDNKPRYLTKYIAGLCGYKLTDKDEYLAVNAGMWEHVTRRVSYELFGDDDKLKGDTL